MLGGAISLRSVILLIISPAVSIFLILIAIAIAAYIISLSIRLNEIEESINNIVGKDTVAWEKTGGLFLGIGRNILITQVGRYWRKIVLLAIIAGLIPFGVTLRVGYSWLLSTYSSYHAYNFVFIYLSLASVTILVGYKFWLGRSWDKLRI